MGVDLKQLIIPRMKRTLRVLALLAAVAVSGALLAGCATDTEVERTKLPYIDTTEDAYQKPAKADAAKEEK